MFNEKHNWFLIRGLAREAGHWGDFPELLKQNLPSANVHTLDFRGAGIYWRESGPFTIRSLAEGIRRDFLDIVNMQETSDGTRPVPNFVLSLSLASMATLEWLSAYPGEVNGAVLINTSLKGLSPVFKRLKPNGLASLLKTLTRFDGEGKERVVLDLISNSEARRQGALESWCAIRQERPVSIPNTLKQLFAGAIYSPPKAMELPPLLLLSSEGDRMVDHSCSQKIHEKFPGSILKVHPSAGHDLPLDDAPWIIDAVKEWNPA